MELLTGFSHIHKYLIVLIHVDLDTMPTVSNSSMFGCIKCMFLSPFLLELHATEVDAY